jgi:hypothetical protein
MDVLTGVEPNAMLVKPACRHVQTERAQGSRRCRCEGGNQQGDK